MYTLKSIARRGTLFGAVAALAVATVLPAASVFADELNPLTKRSLLLSSSAPGFIDTDGSGNSFDNPSAGTPGTYAPAGSGPNGRKTGETFTFNVSTDSVTSSTPIKAISLQYCTTAAGKCRAPGDNTTAGGGVDTGATSDLNVNFPDTVTGAGQGTADGEFQVTSATGTPATDDWGLTATPKEDSTYVEDRAGLPNNTGKKNYVLLSSATGISPVFDGTVEVKFKASETRYITNPGSGSFFVKINTYSDVAATTIIDGGVTVANVMTDSIHITTKVLETMSFSVGTRNRDTVEIATSGEEGYESDTAVHGTCDPIQSLNNNRLQLGDENAEYSLSTDKAYDVYSYWRLSSNSSGGASVYYSGDTLANTVGDVIEPIGAAAAASTTGTEQFGLGFVDATAHDTGKFDPAFVTLTTPAGPTNRFKMPTLNVLDPVTAYENGTGKINAAGPETGTASFAFVRTSLTVPELIAQNNDQVISCDTAKMRYVANIGADTPAGVYTTKINYLAAPQY